MAFRIPPELPSLPGVYIFKNKVNDIIYVGKAKNLKKRVAQYFAAQQDDWKVKALLSEYETIEHIVTQNEIAALLLEAQLIKQYQPPFNVLLKSGNPFVYIYVTTVSPRTIEIVRTRDGQGVYFGPFIHKKDARRCLEYLMRTFKLNKCAGTIAGGCLNYHLGRCAGICRPEFSQQEYDDRVHIAQLFLQGDYEQIRRNLEDTIRAYSMALEFEKARTIAQYLEHMDPIFETIQTHYKPRTYEPDIDRAVLGRTKGISYGDGFQALADIIQARVRTVDCFDISHFQSSEIVGACVRFTDGVLDADAMRKFKIKRLTRQNDYAALQEIVSRRYRGMPRPDVIIIDGGKGQLSAVQPLVHPTPCFALAKREERLYSSYHPEGLALDIHSPLGKFLIALRDYTHHAAVSYHTVRRSKKFLDQ